MKPVQCMILFMILAGFAAAQPPPQVATPVAFPPGKTFMIPVAISLATTTAGASIFYTLDGTIPDTTASGTTRAYTSTIPITATTVIKFRAAKSGYIASAVAAETYTYTPPAMVTHAWYRDADGNGRIESAVIRFSQPLAVTPEKLYFGIQDEANLGDERTAMKAELRLAAGDASTVEAVFTDPFPFGITSMVNRESGRTFPQNNIPLLEAAFEVDDSVPPVLVAASLRPATTELAPRLIITVSEAVTSGGGFQDAIAFKRGAAAIPGSEYKLVQAIQVGDRNYQWYLNGQDVYQPMPGDSVALIDNGTVKDSQGNTPKRKAYIALAGGISIGIATDKGVKAVRHRERNRAGRWTAGVPGGPGRRVDARGVLAERR